MREAARYYVSRTLLVVVWSLLANALQGCYSPTPAPAARPQQPAREMQAVLVEISEPRAEWSFVEAEVGKELKLQVAFQPVVIRVGEDESSFSNLDTDNIAEMRLCTSLQGPCELDEAWLPFTEEEVFQIAVDWLDRPEFHLTAQFRDADGQTVPAVDYPRSGVYQEPESVYRGSLAIVGVLNPETPVDTLPPQVQIAVAPTATPSGVWGSVEIEGGASLVGGKERTTIPIHVAFDAWSPSADIEEMRLGTGGCLAEAEMEQAEWEPFQPSTAFSVNAAINIRGFYVSVEYRDAEGNVSPVYCDDISVEGEPGDP